MTDLKIPRIGEFVRHIGTLVEIQDITPIPPPKQIDYIIEEVEARCELRLNGEVIKTLGTLNDFYGLETSVKSAIEEMKEYATKRNITKNSEIEVVIIRVVSRHRSKIKHQQNFYASEYVDFEYLEFGSLRDMPEPTETIVWSSKVAK